ncbi:MAG: nitronate monooxygenase family protein [Rhizomicrobium sp.]
MNADSRSVRDKLFDQLRLPIMAAPMFLVSGPDLVIAQCKAGVLGSFPALNARSATQLDDWLHAIGENRGSIPFAVNLIVHGSNRRLDEGLNMCAKHKVPVVITSLGARSEINSAIHGYGGLVLHDVIHDRHARKAVERGADGIVAVAAGAGGHGGTQSPFALIQEIRAWYDGPLALAGAISNGRSLLCARVLGADCGYIGSPFIATHEASADEAYKAMVVSSTAADVIYTDRLSGIAGNYLRPSILRAGLDPDNLGDLEERLGLGKPNPEAKIWKDIWGAGQGIGAIDRITSTAALIGRFAREYDDATRAIAGLKARRPQADG